MLFRSKDHIKKEEMNPTISCNSLVGITTPQTIKIEGHIKKKKVRVLIDSVLNIKMQYVPFVCFSHYVDQNISPSVVSMLRDPCHQTSSYLSLEYARSSIQC